MVYRVVGVTLRRCTMQMALAIGIPCLAALAVPAPSQAAIKVVASQGEHLLGQHDTKDDAIRLATEAAKRDALEQVATYLESVTVTTDTYLTRDEIRSYTAGVVTVVDQQVLTRIEGENIVFHVDLTAQIDTDDVVQALKKLREDADVRQELATLKQEVDQLQQELDQANQALASGLPPSDARDVAERRTALLNQMQSNALIQQAWTEWIIGGPYVWPYGNGYPTGVTVPGLLAWAGRLYPNNPHVPVVGTIITARTGAPLPPAPPVPPSPPGTIPHHQQLVSPLQIPANAVIGTAPGNPYRIPGLRQPSSTHPHSGGQPGMPEPGHNPQYPQSATNRLNQFIAPPRIAPPPTMPSGPTQRLPSVSTLPPMYHPDPHPQRMAPAQQAPQGAPTASPPTPPARSGNVPSSTPHSSLRGGITGGH